MGEDFWQRVVPAASCVCVFCSFRAFQYSFSLFLTQASKKCSCLWSYQVLSLKDVIYKLLCFWDYYHYSFIGLCILHKGWDHLCTWHMNSAFEHPHLVTKWCFEGFFFLTLLQHCPRSRALCTLCPHWGRKEIFVSTPPTGAETSCDSYYVVNLSQGATADSAQTDAILFLWQRSMLNSADSREETVHRPHQVFRRFTATF